MNDRPATPRAVLFAAAILLTLILGLSNAHCTPTKEHTNSLGVAMYHDNPYIYVEGAIVGGSIVGTGRNIGTNIRIQPSHTYALFTQELLICGGPSEELANASVGGPLVLTYEAQAHRTVLGIGCHTLLSIDQVKSKAGL